MIITYTPVNNHIEQEVEDPSANEDSSDSRKIKKTAKAFSVIDRVIHAYVDDQSQELLIIKDLSITPGDLLKEVN